MYSIVKEFEFAAAHALTKFRGKCENLHGHNYRLAITITGKLDKDDLVMDFGELKNIVKEHVIDKLDHTNLNDEFENPSCELVAKWIFDKLKKDLNITQVQLWETPNSSVIYNEK
ncbi:MAG: 6-carboxytetrahydropterin synthase QueD [bacterium]|nr:6-carboxytetrahydropterin synthase QueD [bacterium]